MAKSGSTNGGTYPSMALVGEKIGSIKVVDHLERGGMGDVYIGYHEMLDRHVAIKSIRSERRLDLETKARFLREARILSQLDHPNICRIYDYIEGDESDLIVLELINGVNLRQAMRAGLSFEEKIEIAIQVADVLQVAHARSVVHRDLKPENIMINDAREVKVLDFGVSRSLAESLAVETFGDLKDSAEQQHVSFVEQPPMAGEPPEQQKPGANGSLEVNLSEAKTLVGVESDELVETDSSWPDHDQDADSSSWISFKSRAGAVSGTVVYMSPEQARGDFTSTASDMYSFGLLLQVLFTGQRPYDMSLPSRALLLKAASGDTAPVTNLDLDLTDLINSLKSMAPEERPSAKETYERLLWIRDKPKRRRRIYYLTAGLLALALIAGISVQATINARKAMQQQRDTEVVSSVINELFANPEEAVITGSEIRKRGAVIESRLDQDSAEDRAIKLDTLGAYYNQYALHDEAEAVLMRSLELRRTNLEEDIKLADTLTTLGLVYINKAEYDSAESCFRDAQQVYEKKLGPSSAEAAEVSIHLGELFHRRQMLDQAQQLYEYAIMVIEEKVGQNDPLLLDCWWNLADLSRERGEYSKAEGYYESFIAMTQAVSGPEHLEMAWGLNALAFVFIDTGAYGQAEVHLKRALEIVVKTYGEEHQFSGRLYFNLGKVYYGIGDYERAEENLTQALDIYERVLDLRHSYTIETLNSLGVLYTRIGKYREALAMFERSLSASEEDLASDDPAISSRIAWTYVGIGNVYEHIGKHADAVDDWEYALELLEPLSNSSVLAHRSIYAVVQLHLDRIDVARPIVEELLDAGWRDPELMQLCEEHQVVAACTATAVKAQSSLADSVAPQLTSTAF
jgi:serine/threonine protein kinase/Tfp pilus assembly protein PilF